MRHLGDITKIRGNEAPVVDVVIGGSPCQDLSIAGKRAGLAGERSGLYMEQIRIIKEMRKADELSGRSTQFVRPRYMVWENVPGAFSSNGGKDFAAVLEEAIRVVEPETPDVPVPPKGWPTSGCIRDVLGNWSVAWRVLDAQYWGVPQRRRRIALVADFGGLSAPEILFVRQSVSRDIEPGEPTGKEALGDAGEGAGGAVPCTLKIRGGCAGGGKGALIQEDKSATLSTLQDQTLFQPIPFETQAFGQYADTGKASTIKSRDFKDATDLVVAGLDCRNARENVEICGTLPNGGFSYNCIHPVRVGFTVRRLTPMECERLQGFPDGWTDIGEWVDSKGKKHKEADTPRYKALGNSIAIPPWKWVLKRLCACYERDATMASLFDGIGGFPYIWEQLNGRGSCLWASEIEEFPMAVTKLRFGGE